MPLRIAGLLALSAVLLAMTGCAEKTACGDFPLSPEVRQCMTNKIDELVHAHYPFAEQKGIDLAHFSLELADIAVMDLTDDDFLVELGRTVGTLQDGHTRLERHYRLEPAYVPVDYQVVDGHVHVTRLLGQGLPVEVGDKILTIDGQPGIKALSDAAVLHEASMYLAGQMESGNGLLAGPAGSAVRLEVEGRGELTMKRTMQRPSHLRLPTSKRFGEIGYIDISTFGFIDDLDRLDRIVNDLMDTSALIIDLRGNGGGFPSVTDGLFGRLISEKVPEFEMVDVHGKRERTLGPTPRGKTYDKPVVVLTDPQVFSAANYFAQRVVYHNRGAAIGQRTGGGSASPERGSMLVPGIWFQVSTFVLQTPEGLNTEEGFDPTVWVTFDDDERAQGLAAKNGTPDLDKTLRVAIDYLTKESP